MTIIPRGRALGVTLFLPEEDRYSTSKRRLESRIATLFGGRIAEELDLRRRSGHHRRLERHRARHRCSRATWSRSGACPTKLGPLTYSEESGEVFLGRQVTQHKQVSDETAHAIDEEVRRVIDTNYQHAQGHSRDQSRQAARHGRARSIKYETIDENQIKDIMAGRAPKPPADWDDSVGNPPPKRPEGEAEGGSKIGSPGRPALS